MLTEKTYSLCEALADITEIATSMHFYTADSRERISLYILWAENFEAINEGALWGENTNEEYMEAIEDYTVAMVDEYKNYKPCNK